MCECGAEERRKGLRKLTDVCLTEYALSKVI